MYNVGIIGLGSIAEGYGKPDDPYAYCHTGGILHSDRVRLAAVADLDEERRTRFLNKWGEAFPDVAYYNGATPMLDEQNLDIVAVCVRGPAHFTVMEEVIAAGTRSIFLEKPPTCSLQEMDLLVAAAAEKGIPVTVSYSRHWAPHVLRLQELVQQEGLIGEVEKVIAYAGSSVLSFSSHTTDLICQFAGYCPESVMAQGHYREEQNLPDGYEEEPIIDGGLIKFQNGVTGIHVGQDAEHGGLYCDVLGSEGRVRAGIYIPPYACDKDNKAIDLTSYQIPEKKSVFTVAYGQIADYLDGGPLPHCTNEDFTVVHEIGFASIESMNTGQRVSIPVENRSRKVFANG
jgi:predicted dehydrogenase